MKKTSAAILLTFYLAFSSGIVINMHYCMNNFDSIKLGDKKSEVCVKCGMHTNKSNACCHDEVKIIKLQDDQQVATIHIKLAAPIIIATQVFPSSDVAFLTNDDRLTLNNHSPPLIEKDIYLFNSVFRI